MNRRVSVWKYVRVGEKWRTCKPAGGKNWKNQIRLSDCQGQRRTSRTDLDCKRFTIKVTPMPEYAFVIKDHEDQSNSFRLADLWKLLARKR